MKNGTVKFFNVTKGFGFIMEDSSKTDYFVHSSGLVDEIKEGDQVEFDLEQGKRIECSKCEDNLILFAIFLLKNKVCR
ncbi:MAG: cold shock domain-containing protein [Saprospiraceae bacterium]|nr:cold shock domain-containing protein [Saprospiraceae bacterium]